MSAAQGNLATATAQQLAAALEAYEAEVEHIISPHPDPETYQRVRHRLDEMRRYSAALPSLSVAWVELLITHFELTQDLWRSQQGQLEWDEVLKAREQHAHSLARLCEHCRKLLLRSGA